MLSNAFEALYRLIYSAFTQSLPFEESFFNLISSWSALLAMLGTGFVFLLPVILIFKLVRRFVS